MGDDKDYDGVVGVWKKMRQHGIFSADGFCGYSSKQKAIVCADFGAVYITKDDEEFREAMYEHLESCESSGCTDFDIARRYVRAYSTDPFTQDILEPVLARLASKQ